VTAPPRALVANASDEEQLEKARGKETRRAMREVDDLRAVLALPGGRRLLWRILERGRMFNSGFESDTHRVQFNEGRREMATWILAEIVRAKPTAFIEMMQEHTKDTES
jgi:hypothetical protein